MKYSEIKALLESFLLEENLETLNRTYGVEFEMCFNHAALSKYVMQTHISKEVRYSGIMNGSEREWSQLLKIHGLTGWNAHEDSSIKVSSYGDIPIEIVTPPLSGLEGIKQIKDFIEFAENNLGGYINNSCGGHIHIGAKDLIQGDRKQIANKIILGILTAKKFHPLLHSLIPKQRRKNADEEWAQKSEVSDYSIERAKNLTKNDNDYDSNNEIFLNNLIYALQPSRYKAINFHSLSKHGTVEFRIFDGTLNPQLIEERIKFGISVINLFSKVETDFLSKLQDKKISSLDDVNIKGKKEENVKVILKNIFKLNQKAKESLFSTFKYADPESANEHILWNEFTLQVLKDPIFGKIANLMKHSIIIKFKTQANYRTIAKLLRSRYFDIAPEYQPQNNTIILSPAASVYNYKDAFEDQFLGDKQNTSKFDSYGVSPQDFLAQLDKAAAEPYVIALKKFEEEENS